MPRQARYPSSRRMENRLSPRSTQMSTGFPTTPTPASSKPGRSRHCRASSTGGMTSGFMPPWAARTSISAMATKLMWKSSLRQLQLCYQLSLLFRSGCPRQPGLRVLGDRAVDRLRLRCRFCQAEILHLHEYRIWVGSVRSNHCAVMLQCDSPETAINSRSP